jgi:hypothetical protein
VPRLILHVLALSSALALPIIAGCARPPAFDAVIRHGTIYDGTGTPGRAADVAILDDRIAAIGDLRSERGRDEVDATGLAVAPGFINMLSHSETSLIQDGRAQGSIRQGVTLEVFGESSMGPLTEQMKKDQMERQSDIKFNIVWNTLGGYLIISARGVSTNVASSSAPRPFARTEIGLDNRPRRRSSIDARLRVAMDEGAMASPPPSSTFPAPAKTGELSSWRKSRPHPAVYISHSAARGTGCSSDRRNADDCAEANIRRDSSPGKWRVELEQAGRRDREGREGAQGRARDHRRHGYTQPAPPASTPGCRPVQRALRRGRSGADRKFASASAAR